MGAIRTIPRATVNGYLRTLRLPLSTAERIARQRDNDSWAPALAFETLEAKVEGIAGYLLRDDELLATAREREEKVANLKAARTLDEAADVERGNARDQQRRREAQIAQARGRTTRVAAERKRKAKAEAERKKRAANQTASRKAAAVQAQETAQQKAIDRRERATKSEALRAEAEALDLTDKALQAREKADLIDKTLEGNKAARRTG
ncbi:MAG TPA: hypothetical protein VG650_18305 [Mycobacteriales bacterium]|nr:hypothetical protein [Mycobacteriales bacterium]